jgi:putative peptidoglycan lipid II flippase
MTTDLDAEKQTAADELQEQQRTNEGVARASGILAFGSILSRVLGLAREIVLSNLFGASRALEAFNNALVISKSLYDLLLAGHVNSAIVPVLSEVVTVQGRRELWRLVSVLVSVVTAGAMALVAILTLFAPQIVSLIAGSDPETTALSAMLLQLTAPALILLCLFAVLSGTLYALRQFSLPSLAGAIFNGTSVLVTLLFVPGLEYVPQLTARGAVWTLQRSDDGIIIVAVAWLAAAAAQLVLQMLGLRRARIRLTLNWRHPALRRIGLLYAPVLFSLVIDTLVIRLFSYNLAARADIAHGNTYMNWATTLIQFPQGLVATAISVAILPTLSRQASLMAREAATADQNRRAFKDTLGLGLRLTTILILPAVVGLFVLASPIIRLIFERGEFTAADTVITANALRLYLIGLPFAALDLLLVYAFYARQDTLTPALVGVVSLIVYMIVALVLQEQFGLYSLMIADSVKHMTHALISVVIIHFRTVGLGGQKLIGTFVRTSAAALVMGVGAYAASKLLQDMLTGRNFIHELLIVGVSAAVGAVIFGALALLFKVDELQWLMSLLRRRLFPRQGQA